MKKTIIVEKLVYCCDVASCDAEDIYPITCINCGVVHCHDCRKTQGVSYGRSVYINSSEDGYYCNACDLKLASQGDNELHNAYRRIASLKEEMKKWSDAFKRSADEAEAEVVSSFLVASFSEKRNLIISNRRSVANNQNDTQRQSGDTR